MQTSEGQPPVADIDAAYRAFFDGLDRPAAIVERAEPGWRFVAANRAMCRRYGVGRREDRPVAAIFPHFDGHWAGRCDLILRTGEPATLSSANCDAPPAYMAPLDQGGARRLVMILDGRAPPARLATPLEEEGTGSSSFLLEFSDALRTQASVGAVAQCAIGLLREGLALDRCCIVSHRPGSDHAKVIHQVARPDLPALPGRIALTDYPGLPDPGGARTVAVDDIARHPGITGQAARASAPGAFVMSTLRDGPGRPARSILAIATRPRAWTMRELSLIEDAAERTRANMERARVEAELRQSETRFRSLMEGVPQLVWRAEREGWWTWCSPQWTHFTGQRLADSLGLGWLEALHPDDRAAALKFWREAADSGELEMEGRLRDAAGGGYRWFQTRALAVRGEDGAIVEWLGTSTDVQHIKELQERQRLLLAELQHRVRNLLGMVRSIVRQSVERYTGIEDYVAHLVGRMDAMARTQVLLTRAAGAGIDLLGLVWDELEAYVGEGPRISANGPDVELSAKAAEVLTLAIHELATNSVKYGVLGDGGALRVEWRRTDRGPDGGRVPWLELVWRETGHPVPAGPRPIRRGFGTELIEDRIPYELRGEGSVRLRPDGMCVEIAFPLAEGVGSILSTGEAQ